MRSVVLRRVLLVGLLRLLLLVMMVVVMMVVMVVVTAVSAVTAEAALRAWPRGGQDVRRPALRPRSWRSCSRKT